MRSFFKDRAPCGQDLGLGASRRVCYAACMAAAPRAETLLATKEALLREWAKLPPEHRASMLLVLTEDVQDGVYGPWAAEAIQLLSTPQETPLAPENVPSITRADLIRHTRLAPDEIERLSGEDLKHISAAVMQHLILDVFWDEVEYHARERLNPTR